MTYRPAAPTTVEAYSTTTPLGVTGTYQSAIIDVQDVAQVKTMVSASADGTILIESFSDELGADTVRSLALPYEAADGFVVLSSLLFGQYARWSFTNGLVAQTDFVIVRIVGRSHFDRARTEFEIDKAVTLRAL